MRWFGVVLGIAGWLYSGVQPLSPALSQAQSCTVTSSAPSTFVASSFTSFGSLPKAMQSGSSYFQVSCPGSVAQSGKLALSIANANSYNGVPQFRVSSMDSVFTGNCADYVTAGCIVGFEFANNATPRSGNVNYQVSVGAPDGKTLRSANDYAVTIKAELIAN